MVHFRLRSGNWSISGLDLVIGALGSPDRRSSATASDRFRLRLCRLRLRLRLGRHRRHRRRRYRLRYRLRLCLRLSHPRPRLHYGSEVGFGRVGGCRMRTYLRSD